MNSDFISNSKSTNALIAKGKAFARGRSFGLITGEKGVGKTQFARFIHRNGANYSEPFIIFDAGSGSLPEKRLFGESKTPLIGGETIVEGLIAEARRGTLLIKNAGSLPKDAQIRLSNAVQLGGYRPVNSETVLGAECRFLFAMGSEEGLLTELANIFIGNTFKIPPLRDRPEDTEVLALHFLKKWSHALNLENRRFTKQALRTLKRSKWRGNVSELQIVILKALTHFDSQEIDTCHLQMKIGGNWADYTEKELEETALEGIIEEKLSQFLQKLGRYDIENLHGAIMERVERPLIKMILEKAGGNQLRAARILGINRNTLRTKIKKLKIEMETTGNI